MPEFGRCAQGLTGNPASRVSLGSDRDDHYAAAILAHTAVAVADGRIEIDGIAFLEDVPVRTYDDLSPLGHDTDATYRHRRRTRLPGRCPRRAWFEPRGLAGELY